MWAFTVGECGLDHDRFWNLSWFEWSLYGRRHRVHVRELREIEDCHWARFRIQWADFRNAHTTKKSKTVKPTDLIKFDWDDKIKTTKPTPDIEAVKRKFGSKIKKKNGK